MIFFDGGLLSMGCERGKGEEEGEEAKLGFN